MTALQSALARRFIAAPCFPITQLTARLAARPYLDATGEPLDEYDILFVRTIPGGSLEQIIFRMDALHRLENAGVVFRQFTSSHRAHGGQILHLDAPGGRRPAHAAHGRYRAVRRGAVAFHELGGDVVVKPLCGSEGRGMVRVSDPDIAHRVVRALELCCYVYYLQEFVPHGRQDIRVFVAGGQAVAAMVRRGETWETNVAQSAKAEPLALDDELREMALRADRALEADYAVVDILPIEGGGYTVIEVNGIPGWRALQAATGVDVADRLVEYVLGRSANWKHLAPACPG